VTAAPVFLMGMRDTRRPNQFRYLRVPADDKGELDRLHASECRAGWIRPARDLAVRRYAARPPTLRGPNWPAVGRLCRACPGAVCRRRTRARRQDRGGLQAISDFMETNVPEAERARAGDVLIRILNGVLFELAQLTRERAGQPRWSPGDKAQDFMTQAVLACRTCPLYPAPMSFQLKDFTQVQASVFQVARAPGRNIVYLGCALLILGVFAMLYVRERAFGYGLRLAGH
jgi:cytochrome c biogenesis protein